MKPETIIAPATPEGRSAIAVLRVSGPDTFRLLSQLFHPFRPCDITQLPVGRLIYGYLKKDARIVDEVMVAVFKAPHSYTREDMAEIYCHGNPIIVQDIVDVFESLGARLAERGEFTLRAFLNGRIDLTQAEAIMSLINATNKIGLEVGLNQLFGGLKSELEQIRTGILNILTTLEAEINFPEDVGELKRDSLPLSLDGLISRILRMLNGAKLYQGIERGIRVAIVGYPNVGKSSLFNAILREERAIVYDLKGTTRDVITEHFSLGDLTVELMDTAGIMDEVDGIDKVAVERTRTFIESAWLVILVLEAGRPLNDVERTLIREIRDMGKRLIVFVNKMDLFSDWRLNEDLRLPIIYGSTRSEESVDNLLNELEKGLDEIKSKRDQMYVLREFQRQELNSAYDALLLAKEYALAGEREELVSAQLQVALECLDRIEGKEFNEEVLSKVFQEFCIGK